MPELSHILFDFFGTLVSYSPSRTEQGFGRSHALLKESGAELDYARFLARWDGTCEEFEARAQRSLDEYSMDEVCAEFLSRVLRRRPDDDVVTAFRETYLREWNEGVHHIPGVANLLSDLAQRFTLVLVTNTHHADLVHGHLRAMGVARHFANVTTSIEHGRRKPCSSIFERALAEAGGSPAHAVHVGDSFSADYQGARAARIRCLLIDPQRRSEVPEADRLASVLAVRTRLPG